MAASTLTRRRTSLVAATAIILSCWLHVADAFSPQQSSRRHLLISSGAAIIGTVLPTTCADAAEAQKTLSFQNLQDGVRFADILEGKKSVETVQADSKVTFHIVGRLLGKQGWIFLNTQAEKPDADPYRLQLGKGQIILGLEEGMQGMKVGGKRRIVIPSSVGYLNKSLEPIPRDFGNRQRLYTTVMNSVRVDRERQALGADLAGVVVMDVELLRIRT
jgi:hypothetical protein